MSALLLFFAKRLLRIAGVLTALADRLKTTPAPAITANAEHVLRLERELKHMREENGHLKAALANQVQENAQILMCHATLHRERRSFS